MSKRTGSKVAKVTATVTDVAPETTVTEAPSTPNVGKNGRLRAIDLPCICGCGEATRQKTARFLPGHDAKLRAAVRSAKLSWDAVPEIARPFFHDDAAHGEATAGLLMVPGDHGHPLLRDVKAERRNRSVADDASERALHEELTSLRSQLESLKLSA